MKPNFALNLSHDGISLLHRTPGGWHLIGETALDSFDFTETLEFLRQTAVELGGRGLATKLILPNSEILYTEIDAPGPSDEEREEQIKAALADRTPYEPSELSFDWRAKGAKVQVAAVARVTLDEAEDFAVEHRFNPVSFVAIPADDTFAGEPFFGVTGASSAFLERNEKVERDAFPVKIVPLPEAASFKHSEPDKLTDTPSRRRDDPPREKAPPAEQAEDRSEPAAAEEIEASTGEISAPSDVKSASQDTVEETNIPADTQPTDTAGEAEKETETEQAKAQPPEPEPAAEAEPKPERVLPKTVGLSRPEKPQQPVAEAEVEPVSAEATPPDPKPRKRKSKDKDQAAIPAFSSSRTESAEPESPTPDKDPVEPLLLSQARLAVVPGNGKGETPILGAATKTPGVTVASPPDLPALSPRMPTEPVVTTSLAPPPPQLDVPSKPDIPVAPPVALATSPAPMIGVPKPAPIEDMEPPPPVEKPAALTAFGAKRKPAQRGKPPHLALILTLVLLAFLALAAVWSTFVLGDGLSSWFGGGETTTVDADIEEGEFGEPIGEGETTEVAEVEVAPPMSEEVAQAFYDETGIWLRVPTRPDLPPSPGLDDLYVASIDPPAPSHDAIALPTVDPTPNEGKLPAQVNPAPQGTRYELDERGFVIPTAEGAINPDGVRVFTGRPSKITPPRPRTVALPAEALDPIEAAILATFKPRPRPDDLQERFERTRYGGLTLRELAQNRPAPRPEAPQLAATVDTAPTDLAVAQSPTPRHRPDQFAQIIEAAQANIAASAAAAASSGTTASASASVATGRAPSIPTRASVARQATVQNAINLRQLSLIGVYGTSSQRRALLRLRNGRYVKVEVGDRIDGGRVSAIGDSALQYTKGGRNITLQMPDT